MQRSPTNSPVEPSANALADAGLWLARQDAGLTSAEVSEFEKWLLADASHAVAWEVVENTWHSFDVARHQGSGPEMIRELARRQFRRRWKYTFTGLVAAGVAAVAVLSFRPSSNPAVILRPEIRQLSDGSTALLSPNSQIEVDFNASRRAIRLTRGSALFTVAHNNSRPFVVSTNNVEIQAVGTAFSVEARDAAVDVIVTDGRVSVGAAVGNVATNSVQQPQPESVLVDSGNRIVVNTDQAADHSLHAVPISEEQISRHLAWREPRIQLDATRLDDAAVQFNQINRLQLHIADRQLAAMKLSGIFRADDAEGFLRILSANYNVVVRREGDHAELSRQ